MNNLVIHLITKDARHETNLIHGVTAWGLEGESDPSSTSMIYKQRYISN